MSAPQNSGQGSDSAEMVAKQRFLITNLIRIGSLAGLLVGIGTLREAFALPFAIGIALILVGMAGFFFAPTLLAKRWKDEDGR